jgi:hypothetical protein
LCDLYTPIGVYRSLPSSSHARAEEKRPLLDVVLVSPRPMSRCAGGHHRGVGKALAAAGWALSGRKPFFRFSHVPTTSFSCLGWRFLLSSCTLSRCPISQSSHLVRNLFLSYTKGLYFARSIHLSQQSGFCLQNSEICATSSSGALKLYLNKRYLGAYTALIVCHFEPTVFSPLGSPAILADPKLSIVIVSHECYSVATHLLVTGGLVNSVLIILEVIEYYHCCQQRTDCAKPCLGHICIQRCRPFRYMSS